MQSKDIIKTVQSIVSQGKVIYEKYTRHRNLSADYVCIFAHDEEEYLKLINVVSQMGQVIRETEPGPIFRIEPIETNSSNVQLLKIRKPDPTKSGLGYVDFTLPDYEKFKAEYLDKENISLSRRKDYEFIGLLVDDSEVGVYFANPPLSKQLGLN